MKTNYPKGFYDFSKGYDFSNEQVDQWIEECIKKLEENPQSSYYTIASGNTYTSVHRDEIAKYRVFVTKNYQELYID